MDTRGNIRQFANELEAVAAGYDTRLTPEEAQALGVIPTEERQVALRKMRYASFSGLTPKQQAKRHKRRKEQRRARRKQRRAA